MVCMKIHHVIALSTVARVDEMVVVVIDGVRDGDNDSRDAWPCRLPDLLVRATVMPLPSELSAVK